MPKSHRPFFSIVVTCYNTRSDYINTLLNSLTFQGISKEDMQVIISDDCSTDTSFYQIIDQFKDKLNITMTRTDENAIHCPGNNRENGASLVKGKWLLFMDHDDALADNALKSVQDFIKETKEKYFIISSFVEADKDDLNKSIRVFKTIGGWLHGKFYNVDNFWKKADIHFPKDLKTHEDIAICSIVNCEMFHLKIKAPTFFDKITYIYRSSDTSTYKQMTQTKFNVGHGFLECYYIDYLNSTGNIYIEDFKKHINNIDADNKIAHLYRCIDVILYLYFYLQSFKFNYPNDYVLENEFACKEYIRKVVNILHFSRNDIFGIVANNEAKWYNDVRKSAIDSVGNFIEVDSFKEFLFNC